MGRRRRQSTAEDIMDLVALMPWWLGIGLGVASFVVLHRLAVPPTAASGVPGSDFFTRILIAGLATGGQYLVPFLCGLGALTSFMRRKRRAALFDKASNPNGTAAVSEMSWREFEMLVGQAYRLQGFSVTETGGAGADDGVDLVLRRGTERVFVQCKHWKTGSVGVAVVRELFGVVSARGASGGTVITGGTFTQEAQRFAAECKVQLVDGFALKKLLKDARQGAGMASAAEQARERSVGRAAAAVVPDCPVCGGVMKQRTARKGSNAGSQFWGCARFPSCKGTR